jgi:anaerobic glycerol-3-phosphate dehydrogenase
MKPKVYVETTIFSYLAARPSGQAITATRQEITRFWWVAEREKYELVASEAVEAECDQGNALVSAARLDLLNARIRQEIERILEINGYRQTIICTPEELLSQEPCLR